MSEVESLKKELFQEFDKFNSFFSDRSQVPSETLKELLSINKSLFQKLKKLMEVGSETDKKEAMELFANVIKTFSVISKQIVASLGISPEMMKEITAPLAKGNEIIDPEHLKMVSRLGQDLEAMIKQAR